MPLHSWAYHRILTPLLLLPILVLMSFWLRKRRIAQAQRRLQEMVEQAEAIERMRLNSAIGRGGMGSGPRVLPMFIYISPDDRDVRTLSEDELRSIRQRSYADLLDSKSMCTADGVPNEPASVCSICVDDFLPTDQVKQLPCLHVFHTKCIDVWLAEHDVTCPVCRDDVLKALDCRSGDGAADETPGSGSGSMFSGFDLSPGGRFPVRVRIPNRGGVGGRNAVVVVPDRFAGAGRPSGPMSEAHGLVAGRQAGPASGRVDASVGAPDTRADAAVMTSPAVERSTMTSQVDAQTDQV